MTEPLLAEVVLHPVTGTSVVDAPDAVTAENVGEHLPSDEALADAARRLAELGFDVEQAGPVAVTISGRPEQFESTFGVAGPDAGEPQVPEGLRDIVATVAFAQRPELFG